MPAADPASSRAPRLFLAYWRSFAQHTGLRLWFAVALLVLIGVLEGSGVLMLVPLIHALGLGGGRANGGLTALLQQATGSPALPLILAIVVAIKAAQAGLRAWSGNLNLRIETEFTCFLRDRFYRAMIGADWLSLTRQRSSDLSHALLAELPTVGVGTRQFLTLLSVGLVALVQVGIALSLSPMLTLIALLSGTIVGLGLRHLRRRHLVLGELGYGKRAEMTAAVSEHLGGLKIAKSHGRETQHFEHFRRAMNAIAEHALRVQRISALIGIWIEVGAVVALSFFVWCAVTLWHTQPAQLLVLVFVFTRLLGHGTMLQNLWQGLAQSLPSFASSERLRARLDAAAEPSASETPRRLALAETLRVEHVTFAYDPAQPLLALRDLDLVLPARSVTALCGASGAGKSTLADILLGLLAPTSGRVLVDDTPLAGPRLHDWRQSIGYVSQETFLFHETVRANLAWANPGATEADLRAALRAAAAETFVDRLPQGLDTVIGDRGVRLSGGERQRIALARALLRQPTFLVLDEATSSLDAHNERLVQDAIERLRGQFTILVIAHRLSTVRFADRIVVLDAGRIVETGSWQELNARDGGPFRRLVLASAT